MSLMTPEPCCPERPSGLPDEEDAKDLAEKFKALGDPLRLQLMTLVATHADGEVCVCEMTPHFNVTAGTISYHLKVLRTAGLIIGDRRGTWIYYRAIPEALRRLSHVLGHANGDVAEQPGTDSSRARHERENGSRERCIEALDLLPGVAPR